MKSKAKDKAKKQGPDELAVALPANFDFEAALQEMEKLTADLEKGNLSLAQGLACFEAGVKIYQHCATYLAQAEQKIKVLADSLQAEGWQADD